jgi:hypothetical protein
MVQTRYFESEMTPLAHLQNETAESSPIQLLWNGMPQYARSEFGVDTLARFAVLPLIALASPVWLRGVKKNIFPSFVKSVTSPRLHSMNDIAGKVGSSRWFIMVHQVHPDPRATDAADTPTPHKWTQSFR